MSGIISQDQGGGKAAAMMTDGSFGSTSGRCVREPHSIYFPFFKKKTYLFVFGGVSPKPKLTHDECQEEC